MITPVLTTQYPLIVHHPALSFDLEYLKSVAGAGALPVFDTEFYSDENSMDIIRSLEKESFTFAVRLSINRKNIIEETAKLKIKNLELLILAFDSSFQSGDLPEVFSNFKIFIETGDICINDKLERLSPAGIILKGFEGPGRVSRYSSFILMQWYLKNTDYPLFIHGGVGMFTGAGLLAAGAAGFVFDSQLYLCDEAPVSPSFKKLIADINETDTVVAGETVEMPCRFFARPGTKTVKKLKEREITLSGDSNAAAELYREIENNIVSMADIKANPNDSLFFIGQDASFAKNFITHADNSSSRVKDIIYSFFKITGENLAAIDNYDPMVESSPAAMEHGTKYPIIQGPMANISDNADFARAVYDNGGLPFFAMGNLPEKHAEKMIKEGRKKVPRFGAGLIGIETFNRTIHRHFDIVKENSVPFALFAGGVPSQVIELESAGIKTYLHTPNTMMLKNALDSGCTRFILEGTEAGGHVGSLTSLVLWESAINVLSELDDESIKKLTVVFAGGISTSFASSFISGLSSALASRGVKICIQAGTAYLFTKEIVETGSIGQLYQSTVSSFRKTLVTGNTVGLPSRTVPTIFAKKLVSFEHEMIKNSLPLPERKTKFEEENLGSLLISAKGFLPDINGQHTDKTTYFSETEQIEKGNFLSGDSLAFLEAGTCIADIHRQFFHEKVGMFRNLEKMEVLYSTESRINDDIAITGIGCILPDARDTHTLWNNIIKGVYSIRDMPDERMDSDLFFDANRHAEDRSYTKIAGLINDFVFDHDKFKIDEKDAKSMSRTQQILLHTADQAISSAGYFDSDGFNHEKAGRTAVIVASCLGNEKSNDLQLRCYIPEITDHLEKIIEYNALQESEKEIIKKTIKQSLSDDCYGPDQFDGVALHMEAGVIARYLGTKGAAYVVDAACATSFAALSCAVNELLTGSHDTVVVAGANTNLSPEAFIGFGKMGALSAEGSWPFDNRADGFVLGEGAAGFVLKRFKDAIRDNCPVYGVIRGIGSSSDGRGKAIAAPNPAGQALALTRCFEKIKTGITVSDIDFIEAHGTSTIMGDQAEFETLEKVYPFNRKIGISSIKSQIGHLLGGAGAAGLLKVLLAIKHKTLPPMAGFKSLSENISTDNTSFYIITKPERWETEDGSTRKAAVSSYGFGGINYHVVVEEFDPYGPLFKRTIFADPLHNPNDMRIVFTGPGAVLPGAVNSDELIKHVPGQHTESVDFPAELFNISRYTKETDAALKLPELKAGIVSDFKFNNMKYKIPPMAVKSIDRSQLFALDAAAQAIANSGISDYLTPGNRTGVVIGTPAGRQHAENILRVRAPFLGRIIENITDINHKAGAAIAEKLVSSIRARFPKNTEDTVPGFLSNIVSGRITNFFGLNGPGFIVDAGNASSATALHISALSLKAGEMDNVISGGVDTNLYPFSLISSYRSGLFSEENFNGTVSEGAALLVMTTLKNAQKNNFQILAEYTDGKFTFNPSTEGFKRHSEKFSEKRKNDFGSFRYAETAVDLTLELIKKKDNPTYKTSLISIASGGLSGIQFFGSLPKCLSKSNLISIKKESELSSDEQKDHVVALLSGQGSQSPGMMSEIYENDPDVKDLMDKGEAIFRAERGYSLLSIMFGNDPSLNLTENTQPAVFLSTAAVYNKLRKLGFFPDAVIGHSIGEFTALYCMGLLDFSSAMNLVLTRSRLMKEAADRTPGKIIVVFAGADETESLIRKSGFTVYLANKNSNRQTAVSGASDQIEKFCLFLRDNDQMFTKLSLSGAFHSPLFLSAAEELGKTLETMKFNTAHAGRIIANSNAKPYPENERDIKGILKQQITSPVEFTRSVKNVFKPGRTRFVEIGPDRLLAGLVQSMGLSDVRISTAVNEKKGQYASYKSFLDELTSFSIIGKQEANRTKTLQNKEFNMNFNIKEEDGFSDFIKNNSDHLKKMLYNEYMQHKKQQIFDAVEKFDFNPGKIVISGVSVGLPGTGKNVFDSENFKKLLSGTSFIEPIPLSIREKIVDKNVTRLHKAPDGNARFVEITSTDDVIQLAGQLGYFDPDKEYGIKKQYDTSIALAMAAGIEALKDAHIPLVMQYRQASTGTTIADGYVLPEEMQQGTGVILSSLWPYSETLIEEMTKYFYNKFYVKPYDELEKIYYHIIETVKDDKIKEQVTEWFFRIRERRKIYGEYKLTRDFAHNITPLGSAHFAQYIKAKGPNIQMSGACASTTQAIGIAEDWIRTGRCDRVIVLGAETPSSENQCQWIGAGFLSLGAASIKKNIAEAAKPFDADRNGTILGSGAVSLIIEKEDTVKQRGMSGQAEVLGTWIGNTAFHTYNIDVKGIASEMKRFVGNIEKRHNLKKEDYSKKMVFMSHETFTPARGGSADAEISALRATYPDTYRDIVISNTKGFTGHTLGAALEDAVLVKVLQTGTAPPIANLKDIEENFKDLKLSKTPYKGDFQYGFHIAAGFGSHLSFTFLRRIEEKNPENNSHYKAWLKAITGSEKPALTELNSALIAEAGGDKIKFGTESASSVQAIAEDNYKADPESTSKQNIEKVEENITIAEKIQPAEASETIAVTIKSMISSQTGYDVDMLEDELDLEADLGIDTVKQVEIFGKISAKYGLKVPENLKLKDLNTISKIVDYMKARVKPEKVITAAKSDFKDPQNTSVTDSETESAKQITDQKQPASSFSAEVKSVIAAQTGYDVDMLEDELDLEADLGIDTVKQVEIFGKISAKYGLKVPENLKLKDLNTVSKIVRYIEEKTIDRQQTVIKQEAYEKNTAELEQDTKTASGVKRYTVDVIKTDRPGSPLNRFENSLILVTMDSYGFSDAVRREIKKRGGHVITIGRHSSADIRLDLNRPAQLEDSLSDHRILKNINGLIHLAPLDYCMRTSGTLDFLTKKHTTDDIMNTSVKSLFVLVKNLKDALDRPGALIAAPSVNSVVFPYMKGFTGTIYPAFSGVSGFLKTVAKEYRNTLVRIIDFAEINPKNRIEEMAEIFIDDISSTDNRIEKGFSKGDFFVPVIKEKQVQQDTPFIRKKDVILVTGGALGITYEIIRKTAVEYQAELIIAARSDISKSVINEDEKTITSRLKEEMKGAKPFEIRKEAQKIIRAGDAARNIKLLKEEGIKVTYERCDVTDAAQVENIFKKHRNISGVIHGAGIEESQFIEKKTLSSVSRVMDVKVKGLDNIIKALKNRPCRYIIAFSSVTARFGNEGQCDYTAANDMICKMLMREKQIHPERKVKIFSWTAWSGAGMAENETVKKVLESKGITFLPVTEGVRFFMNDMLNSSDAEVVITAPLRQSENDSTSVTSDSMTSTFKTESISPFLDRSIYKDNHKARFSRTLRLHHDLFLQDHSMYETPIFLGATGIETMAEAAHNTNGNPEVSVREIREFSIPYGIKILKGRPKEIIIDSEQTAVKDENVWSCQLSSVFTNHEGKTVGEPTIHYSGQIVIDSSYQPSQKIRLPEFDKNIYKGDAASLIYHPERLFMGDLFQTIKDVLYFKNGLLVTEFSDTSEKPFFASNHNPFFLTDITAVDAMFQTGGLYEFFTDNNMVLPYKIRKMTIHGRVIKKESYICLTEKTDEDETTCIFQLKLVDRNGNLIINAEDFSMVKLAKLDMGNRITDRLVK